MRYLWLAVLAPLAVEAQGVTQSGARPVSLEEAVRLAQQNSPLIVQAKGQVRASDAAIRTVYGAYLPTLSLSYGSNRQGGETFFQGQLVPFRGDPWNFTRGLNSNIELFDGGRRLFQMRAARANLTAAESNERLQKFRIALDVKQQYYNILAARESRAAAQAQLAQAEQQLRVASARVAAGAATLSDSLRSLIQVGNGQLSVLTAENNIRVASASLTRLVGTSFQVTAADSGGEPVTRANVDSAEVMRWIEEAPSIMQVKAEVAAASASIRQSKVTYLPTLNLGGNYNGSRTDRSFSPAGGPYAGSHAMRLTFSYQVFNGLQREENVVRANVAESNALSQLRDTRLAAQQQLAQLLGSLHLAEARMSIQRASVQAGEEDLRVQNTRYALGSSTLLDVLTSQSTLNQARFSLIQARLDARLAKAQLEALIGRDIP